MIKYPLEKIRNYKDIWQNKLKKKFCLLSGEVLETYDTWKKRKNF